MESPFADKAYVSNRDACVVRRGGLPRDCRFPNLQIPSTTTGEKERWAAYQRASPWQRKSSCLRKETSSVNKRAWHVNGGSEGLLLVYRPSWLKTAIHGKCGGNGREQGQKITLLSDYLRPQSAWGTAMYNIGKVGFRTQRPRPKNRGSEKIPGRNLVLIQSSSGLGG